MDGETAIVSLFVDDYEDSAVATYTINAPRTAGRQKFIFKTPLRGTWRRYGIQIVVAVSSSAVTGPKFYSVGDFTPEDLELI